MRIAPFAMERLQSTYENLVEFNLSESGVHPLRTEELLDDREELSALLALELGYPQTNGTPELRAAVAALHPGATPSDVEVTNGGAEANFLAVWHLLEKDDETVLMLPNYMQIAGLAEAFGGPVHRWWLRAGEDGEGRTRWTPDLDRLESLVTSRTRLIAICNPNNPTGTRLERDAVEAVCTIAARQGAWVLSDEIYRGAELDGNETPTAWGLYERVIVTGGLSKAYGLPGLRIGWLVAPADLVATLWSHHDYTTIAPAALSDRLARVALTPAKRNWLRSRARGILRANYPLLRDWLDGVRFTHAPPEAGAIAFVRYPQKINSSALADDLRQSGGVLVVPGDHFAMDGFLRIGYGGHPEYLRSALRRVGERLAAFG
jgi:aspartate/methionine/tyrosine aminotransferase